MPMVMVFGDEALERCLGLESEALMNGIGVLIKETPHTPLAHSTR